MRTAIVGACAVLLIGPAACVDRAPRAAVSPSAASASAVSSSAVSASSARAASIEREPSAAPVAVPAASPLAPCGRVGEPASAGRQRRAVEAMPKLPRARPRLMPFRPHLPAGFRASHHSTPSWFGSEPTPPHRHRAFHGSFDEGPDVFVEVLEHAPLPVAQPRQWAESVLARHHTLVEDVSPRDILDHVVVYSAAWQDAHQRLHFEHAWIPKGCDRVEIYVRFIQDGRRLLEIELGVLGTAPPERAAPWLHAFFDAPLGVPAPAERRFAWGHSHNL